MTFGGDNLTINENGWTMLGGGHIGGRTSFNLLGGYMSFDMDVTNARNGVNTNLYVISPENGVDNSGYCDIQPNGSPQCMELDFIENNGACFMQATWHTSPDLDGGCDEWGCAASAGLSSSKFSVKSEFTADGFWTTHLDGVAVAGFYPYPDDGAVGVVQDTMNRVGAAFWSSQWQGWVPDGDQCSGYDGELDASSFTVSNLQVFGTVVQGVIPNKCGSTDDDDDDTPPSDDDDDDNTPLPGDDDDDDTPPPSDDDDNAPTCFVEENYDYNGFDLSYDDVQGPSQCCEGCAGTGGCVAWTFSADTWGDIRCYYKSSMDGRTYQTGLTSGYLNSTSIN